MAKLHLISCHVFVAFVSIFIGKCAGDTVHVMSVTTTPYGAYAFDDYENAIPVSFTCLLSQPDTDLLSNIQTGRHVLSKSTSSILTLPVGSSQAFYTSDNFTIFNLPVNTVQSQGVYYCEASNRGLTTRVPVTILRGYMRYLQPSNGQFTVTVSVGSYVSLITDVRVTPVNYTENTDIYWERQGNETADFQLLNNRGTGYTISSASEADAGVFYAYWRGLRDAFTGSLFRLIVRSCSNGRWGHPSCTGICDNCYNGGICDDKTGECVCRPGFTGPNCLTVCGENEFGWDCEHHCSFTLGVITCSGSLFCMPDPVGCSCMTGWMGTKCNQECPAGMYGAGCTQSCNCQSGLCDRFTGRCSDGMCLTGWTGDNCQIPTDICPYGSQCLGKCYCNNCDKATGCMNSECYTGYWGEQCETQCGSCNNCDGATGCMNDMCYAGWGEQCDKQCGNCFPCDRTDGYMNSQCTQGYWGEQCDIECHCLNGVACDNKTGKCNADPTTGLSLCEPGYVSDTGVNLDNCQQSVFCFSGCTRTCHCNSFVQCDDVSGLCPGTFCQSNWGGASCQTGIIEVGYEKTNPNQAVTITCTVTGDSVPPNANQVTLNNWNGNMHVPNIGQQVSAESKGVFLITTFNVSQPVPERVVCSFSFMESGIYRTASATITPQYYDLPRLSSPPRHLSTFSSPTTVWIQWNAWNPDNGDTGDGPIVSYIVHVFPTSEVMYVGDVGLGQIISRSIQDLTPNTEYTITVQPIREGPGGEGYASPPLTVITKAMSTLSPPQNLPTTTKQSIPPGPTKSVPPAVSVPGPPRNMAASVIKETSVTLEWDAPEQTNGVITFYHIGYRIVHKSIELLVGSFTNATKDVRRTDDTHHDFDIGNLEPATSYEVYISAENSVGQGKSGLLVVETVEDPIQTGSQSGSSMPIGIAVGVSAAVIIVIIIVALIVLIFRRKRRQQTKESEHLSNPSQGILFENPAFAVDVENYEEPNLDDQEYEEMIAQWDIAWEDLNLSGQILGKGNFGDVQMAMVKIKEKWIKAAVKTLKQGTPESERELFEEEFDTMTRIGKHPNVVNILGSCKHAGSFYVVLEYIHHGNLRKFLRQCRKKGAKRGQAVTDLRPDQLLNFAIGVAKAMKHISDCGIIHRDLAARNVLVGRGLTPKVSDFGMSREQDVYVQASKRRVPTRWLSIESLTKRMYSTKSDVWSFGILLWEIATLGGTPYSNIQSKHLAHRLTGGYRMPKPENCEDDMYKLMMQCWQEDPDARPTFKDIVNLFAEMEAQDKIYMSTHFYENYKHAAIRLDIDDR